MAKNISVIPRFSRFRRSPLAARRSRVLAFYRVQKKNKRLLAVKTLMTPFRWSRSGSWSFKMITNKLIKKTVRLYLHWLCTKRQFSGDRERELETFSRMTNRPTVDDDFSSFSDFFFSIVQNRMKKQILEKRSNHTRICRHTTHGTKRGTKGQTSQLIDMQLHEAVNYVVSDWL